MSDDKDKKPANPWAKSLLIWVGILFGLVLFVQMIDGPRAQASEAIPYSDFVRQVGERNVESVTTAATASGNQVITGKLNSGESFRTIAPKDAQITEEEHFEPHQSLFAEGDEGDCLYIIVNGHADRLGSPQYNQQLSEKRAEAVRAYLVSKGVDASGIETLGFGKTLPVKSCPDQERKALIECLAPNRRVVVEVQGMPR